MREVQMRALDSQVPTVIKSQMHSIISGYGGNRTQDELDRIIAIIDSAHYTSHLLKALQALRCEVKTGFKLFGIHFRKGKSRLYDQLESVLKSSYLEEFDELLYEISDESVRLFRELQASKSAIARLETEGDQLRREIHRLTSSYSLSSEAVERQEAEIIRQKEQVEQLMSENRRLMEALIQSNDERKLMMQEFGAQVVMLQTAVEELRQENQELRAVLLAQAPSAAKRVR